MCSSHTSAGRAGLLVSDVEMWPYFSRVGGDSSRLVARYSTRRECLELRWRANHTLRTSASGAYPNRHRRVIEAHEKISLTLDVCGGPQVHGIYSFVPRHK